MSLFDHKSEDTNRMLAEREILRCFPAFLHNEANSLMRKMHWRGKYISTESFQIKLDSEIIHIPYRIYYDEEFPTSLTENELLILDCFFTRHHNGQVRERHLINILTVNNYLVTPFIAQLLGEYVVEILTTIKENLTPALIKNLITLKADNPEFFKKTEERIQSYWNCYYKRTILKKDYPGFQILLALK
jgi:hypothetical protein